MRVHVGKMTMEALPCEVVDSVPDADVASSDHDEPDGADEALAEGGDREEKIPVSGKDVRAMLSKKKADCANTMKFSAAVLADPSKRRVLNLLTRLPAELLAATAAKMKELKSRSGTLSLMQGLHRGDGLTPLHSMTQTFSSAEFARSIGLAGFAGSGLRKAEASQIASLSWKLVVSMLAQGGTTHMAYMHLPPFAFLGLTSSDDEEVASCLQRLRKMWHVLSALEVSSIDNPERRASCVSLKFPGEQFIRELFVRLEEAEFGIVPEIVRNDVVQFAESWGSTLMVENMFNLCRQ